MKNIMDNETVWVGEKEYLLENDRCNICLCLVYSSQCV